MTITGRAYRIFGWTTPLALLVLFGSLVSAGSIPCNVSIDRYSFRLCPLLESRRADSLLVSVAEETPPTRTKRVYRMNLQDKLHRDYTLPAELQCPEGTWICLTVENTRPSHPSEPTRILQVVPISGEPGLVPKFKLLPKEQEDDGPHGPLRLTLHGGKYTNQTQKASLVFYCDVDAPENSTPEFAWNWNGTHTFSWKTKHACAEVAEEPTSPPPPPEADPDPPAEPPADPDAEEPTPPGLRPSTSFVLHGLLFTLFVAAVSFVLRRWSGVWARNEKLYPYSNELPLTDNPEHGKSQMSLSYHDRRNYVLGAMTNKLQAIGNAFIYRAQMSSFSQLHASRKSKAAKSFLNTNSSQPIEAVSVPETLVRNEPEVETRDVEMRDVSQPSKIPTAEGDVDATSEHVESKGATSIAPDRMQASKEVVPAEEESPHGLYNELPNTLVVRSTKRAGRGLWATAPYRAGSTLISVKPHIAALSNQHLSTHCSACFAPASSSGLKRCTQCQTIFYCTAACQNRDWSLHKRECTALQNWAKSAPSSELSVPSDAVRCLARILWRKQKLGLDSAWAKEIDAMQSHRKNLQASSYEVHAHLSQAFVRYLGLSSPEELAPYGLSSIGDLLDLVSRFITNTFTITSPSLTPLGASVSPIAALVNHSCDPNAVIVFPRASSDPEKNEPLLQIIAIKPIAPNEEITTSYIDITLPRLLRRKSLRETYHFTCECSLCSKGHDVDPRESLHCPRKCGGRCPIPTQESDLTRCTSCKAVVSDTDSVLDAVRLGQEALDKATKVQLTDPNKALQLTSKLVPILLSAGVCLSSHPLLALSRLHQTLLISSLESSSSSPTSSQAQEKLDDAIRVATRSFTGLDDVLIYGHPVRGIALAELGKLLAVDEPDPKVKSPEAPVDPSNTRSDPMSSSMLSMMQRYPPSGAQRLKLACETLIRARNELLVGFGYSSEGGLVGKEVREMVASLEKELQVWNKRVREALEDAKDGKKS
ncbi:hypothetical protein AX16_009783 [Volvariella volvacea WC 439]|nr:hypothetical protein AX16_009783 [Volvariella volvacea WC 439]